MAQNIMEIDHFIPPRFYVRHIFATYFKIDRNLYFLPCFSQHRNIHILFIYYPLNLFSSQSAANGGPNGGGTASSSTIELKRRMMNFFERKSSTGSNNHQSHVNSINNSLRGGFNRQSRSQINIELFVWQFYLYPSKLYLRYV